MTAGTGCEIVAMEASISRLPLDCVFARCTLPPAREDAENLTGIVGRNELVDGGCWWGAGHGDRFGFVEDVARDGDVVVARGDDAERGAILNGSLALAGAGQGSDGAINEEHGGIAHGEPAED